MYQYRLYCNVQNILKNFKVCISCINYRKCAKYKHYLGVCDDYKHFQTHEILTSKKMKPEPKMKKLIYIDSESTKYTNAIYIECGNDEVCKFIENNACKYGDLTIWQKKTKNNNIPIYHLKISKLFNTNEVITYLLSYNE